MVPYLVFVAGSALADLPPPDVRPTKATWAFAIGVAIDAVSFAVGVATIGFDYPGGDQAKVIVNAIDDVESNIRLVEVVKQNFPNATVVSRARNVNHFYELRRLGVTLIEREVFDSALGAGRRVLEALGVHPFEARERAFRFRRHNLTLLENPEVLTLDDDARISRARAGREELERQFQLDTAEIERLEGGDWQNEREADVEA